MASVTVRLSTEEREAWREAARRRGMSLTGFLKLCVREATEARSSSVFAASVAEHLLPEIERVLANPVSLTPVPTMPKPFDRGCFDADLHRSGQVCAGCGGSF